jgi:hypothetical protein
MLSTLAHKIWLSIAATIGVLMVAVVALTPANAASPMKTETGRQTVLKCDAKALDAKHSDDCVQHLSTGDAADGRAKGGNLSKLKVIIAPELRGRSLFGEIQFRSVDAHGVKSKWWTHRTIMWHANDTVRAASKAFDACAPVKAGKYEVRAQVSVPVSKEMIKAALTNTKASRSRAFDNSTPGATPSATPTSVAVPNVAAPNTSSSSSPTVAASASPSSSASISSSPKPSGSPSSATSSPAPTAPFATSDALATSAISPMTVTQSSPTGSCANSPNDEILIEYFNEVNFEDEFVIIKTDTGTTFNISIFCPPAPDADYPGPDFNLTMSTKDRSASSNCNSSQPIVINKSQLNANRYSYCSYKTCAFTVALSNASTGSVFSSTMTQVVMTSGNEQIIPELQPATEPICTS